MNYVVPPSHPFNGLTSWHGKCLSYDGASTDVSDWEQAVVHVIWSWETPRDSWDGSCAALCSLGDGRFVAWESNWGPTGEGFAEEAYGGDANITVALSVAIAIELGLSPEYRARLNADLPTVVKDWS